MAITFRQSRRCVLVSATALCLGAAEESFAANAPALPAIAELALSSRPQNAVVHAVKLRLADGKGIARALIQIGVDQTDAAAAAKLAAGRLGEGNGGCDVRFELSASLGRERLGLERAVLLTSTAETVIERRGTQLAIASEKQTSTRNRLT